MAAWIFAHVNILKGLAYILLAFSFLFGSKVLGRFPALARPKGFYSSVLVAIPAAAIAAGLFYLFDVATNGLLFQSLASPLPLPFSGLSISEIIGICVGIIVLSLPILFRGRWSTLLANSNDTEVSGLSIVLAYPAMFVLQIIFLDVIIGSTAKLFGWFTHGVPFIVIVVLALLQTALAYINGFSRGYVDGMREEMGDAESHFAELMNKKPAFSSLSAHDRQAAISKGAQAAREEVGRRSAPYITAAVITGIVSAPLNIADLLAILAFTIYTVKTSGVVALFFIPACVLGYYLIVALRRASDGMSSGALGAAFAIPGAIGSVILYLVTHPDMVRQFFR